MLVLHTRAHTSMSTRCWAPRRIRSFAQTAAALLRLPAHRFVLVGDVRRPGRNQTSQRGGGFPGLAPTPADPLKIEPANPVPQARQSKPNLQTARQGGSGVFPLPPKTDPAQLPARNRRRARPIPSVLGTTKPLERKGQDFPSCFAAPAGTRPLPNPAEIKRGPPTRAYFFHLNPPKSTTPPGNSILLHISPRHLQYFRSTRFCHRTHRVVELYSLMMWKWE